MAACTPNKSMCRVVQTQSTIPCTGCQHAQRTRFARLLLYTRVLQHTGRTQPCTGQEPEQGCQTAFWPGTPPAQRARLRLPALVKTSTWTAFVQAYAYLRAHRHIALRKQASCVHHPYLYTSFMSCSTVASLGACSQSKQASTLTAPADACALDLPAFTAGSATMCQASLLHGPASGTSHKAG